MGASSEVGASLGAAWIAQRVLAGTQAWTSESAVAEALDALLLDLDGVLSRWIAELGDPELAPELATRYFLFGFLCAVVDGDRLTVFGLGDGVFGVGGRIECIDPGPDNAPPYATYRVLPEDALELDGRPLQPVLHHHGPLAVGDTVFIATDGAQPIATELMEWLGEPSLWSSTQALTRRLNLAARRLPDDTTVVALTRQATPCA